MKKSIFYIFLLSFSFFAISCEDDPMCNDGIQNGDETGIDCGGDCAACVLSVEEDKANIQKTFDDLFMCVTDLKNSRAVDIFLRDFLKLSDGEALNESWIDEVVEGLEDVMDLDHIDDNMRLDLAYHAGTHIYNSSNESWDKVNDFNDRMVFRFPSEPTLTTNNVELVMDKYEDQQVTIDGETVYLPTAVHILMNVDGIKMMDVDIEKVTYASNQDFEIPVEISATVLLAPIAMTLNLERISTTEYRLESTIEDGSSCSIGLEVDLELKDDDFENLGNDGFEKVLVKVNVGQMTIQSLADMAGLFVLDDPSDTQINSFLDIDALFDGVKIADIEISEEQETVFIFYKDSSSEDSEKYYEPFWEDIKDLWDEFFE